MDLAPEDRLQLKKPFGVLIKNEAISRDIVLLFARTAAKIISVGDATTRRLSKEGIIPDLAIVDGKERRMPRRIPTYPASLILHSSNPPGTVSDQAINAIRKALGPGTSPARLIISGEEDLLVLPVCVYSPLRSVILYGQPLEGMVVVEVTQKKKAEASALLEKLRTRDLRTKKSGTPKNPEPASRIRK